MPAQDTRDYAALAKQFGGTVRPPTSAPRADVTSPEVDYAALARQFGGQRAEASAPDFRASNATDVEGRPVVSVASSDDASWLDSLVDYGRGLASSLNPLPAVAAVGAAMTEPPETTGERVAAAAGPVGLAAKRLAPSLGLAQGELATKAKHAFDQGDYATGLRHALSYLLPLIGPAVDAAGNKMAEGQIAEGLGEATGLGLQVAAPKVLPKVLSKLPDVSVTPRLRNPNPVEAAAVDFGLRQGIPIDAGTATGNKFARGAQHVAEHGSIAGSVIGQVADRAQGRALAQTATQLAEKAHPSAVTPELAGEGLRAGIAKTIEQFRSEANAAYSTLRNIEADPANLRTVQINVQGKARGGGPPVNAVVSRGVALPVDLRGSKSSLKPVYDQLKRESDLVPLRPDKARALAALDRLMQGPDHAPLSEVDAALSDLKSLARTAPGDLRTPGQGIAAKAVSQLDVDVKAVAASAGPKAAAALDAGRKATIAKYAAADVLKKLIGRSDEPVQAYRRVVSPQDSTVAQLRKIAQLAPSEPFKVGRAYLDGLIEKATAEGGFQRAAGISADWAKLGDETKRLLFRDPHYIKDLDNFFLLAKKISENPNPSGTGRIALVGHSLNTIFFHSPAGIATELGGAALATLLRSRRGVRLLTQGMTVSPKSAAAPAIAAELAKAAQGTWQAVPVAAEADSSSPNTPRTGPPPGAPR